ncbi:MAG TPA: carbohydrate ABC transporter permease [Acidimicrobiia bacterium]|nr:carbohydrate ABC transporter permease [Acidimicrobiia bacterium]
MSASRKTVRSATSTLTAGFLSLFAVVPLLWVLTTSVRTKPEILRDPLGLPTEFHFGNYVEAWVAGNFSQYFLNSLLVVVPTVAGVLALSLLAAYAFALYVFPMKRTLFIVLLFGMTVPVGILIIPLYYQMLSLGLLDSLWAIILPQLALGIPISTLLLRTFIAELPGDIIDAARLDGCGSMALLWRVVFPLSRSAMITLVILQFMWIWNQFLLPVVLIQDRDARTLPTALSAFLGRYGTDTHLLMAGAAISFLPVVIIFVIFQKRFIKGISAGALGSV